MIESDLKRFADILDSLSDYYQRDPLKPMAVKIYFKALEAYEIDQIAEAVTMHLQDTEAGKFYPKAADLIKHIDGGEITSDYIVAAARLADTPLGVLARIHIGTWDLDNLNSFDLKQRAAECLQLLPNWKSRAMAGEYRDHEISMMVKHNVNPVQPFAMGLAGPQNSPKLISRVEEVSATDRHKELLEPPHRVESVDSESVSEDGIKRIKQELKGL